MNSVHFNAAFMPHTSEDLCVGNEDNLQFSYEGRECGKGCHVSLLGKLAARVESDSQSMLRCDAILKS